MSGCIFCRIVAGEIPAGKVFEDEDILAFKDIHPARPVHVLVIPKKPIKSWATIADGDAALVAHIVMVIRNLAVELQLEDGYRVVCNSGDDGGQTVDHLHFHLLGGRPLRWPPG